MTNADTTPAGGNPGAHDLPDTARATTARHDMLPDGSVVLAMVSGGADSTALLLLLADGTLGANLRVSVLHVNHMIRGAEADADEAFVRGLCESLGVPCAVQRVDVPAFARDRGLNLEDAGRRVRHAAADTYLDAACAAAGAPADAGRIAIAHNRDDRHETFLMRLAQGTGAAGLTTLAPIRGRIVRPLIDVSRAEIREWLGLLGHEWREDATNADTSRLRARVRADLLPVLRDINPGFDGALARTIEVLADESELLGEMADAFARDFAGRDGEAVEFDSTLMATLSIPMRRRTIRAALFAAFPESSRLEFGHVEALTAGVMQEGFARDLPEGLSARTRYGTMAVFRIRAEGPVLAHGVLDIPGNIDLGPGGVIDAELVAPDTSDRGPDRVVMSADSLGDRLQVTPFEPGDRMRPLGMAGSRKLADMLVDAKVPRELRRTIPVVRDGETVVWLAGVRLAEEYKVTNETKTALLLTWNRAAGCA
ncbi:MAG: tRNA lysidine(34) synthetase TilS [Coriobacteriia bacterium]